MNTANTYFFLPERLQNKFNKKIEDINEDKLLIEYRFSYAPGMIECIYDYYLDKDDIDFLMQILAENNNIKYTGDMFSFLNNLIVAFNNKSYIDTRTISILEDNIENLSKISKEKLMNYCKDKAFKEFKAVFELYNFNDEDKDEYYETDEI